MMALAALLARRRRAPPGLYLSYYADTAGGASIAAAIAATYASLARACCSDPAPSGTPGAGPGSPPDLVCRPGG